MRRNPDGVAFEYVPVSAFVAVGEVGKVPEVTPLAVQLPEGLVGISKAVAVVAATKAVSQVARINETRERFRFEKLPSKDAAPDAAMDANSPKRLCQRVPLSKMRHGATDSVAPLPCRTSTLSLWLNFTTGQYQSTNAISNCNYLK